MTVPAAPARTSSPGVWRLVIPAPSKWISENEQLHWAERDRRADAWRRTAYLLLLARPAALRPPEGLAKVRVEVELHFRDHLHRDPHNFTPTAKPVVDALGPPFVRPPTRKQPKGRSAPGYGVIPDDTPEHLDGPHLTVGRLWREVAADLPQLRGTRRHHGGMTVVITDLSSGEGES